jgi:hypothetical protein
VVGNLAAVSQAVQEVHFMMNQAELLWGRFNSSNPAPIGSYVNFRTMAVFQQATDGNVPAAGTWCRVDPNNAATLASLATTINTALGTSFTSSNLHSYSAVDNVTSPGQMTNDA